MSKKDDDKIYECEQMPAIIYIPSNTVKLKITATLMDEDDKLFEVVNVMPTKDVIQARIEGEEWEFDNVKYVLTDEGKAYLDSHKK